MAKENRARSHKTTFITLMLCLLFTAVLFSGCATSRTSGAAPASATPSAPSQAEISAQAVQEAKAAQEAQAAKEALEKKQQEAVAAAQLLRQQYDYEGALKALSAPDLQGGAVATAQAAIKADMATLVNYTGDIPHIFFHSLIVYPEMIFTDKKTPMGGYNSGFSEKAEMLKMLPQLYARGYVLYDLNNCWTMVDGVMTRQKIMLPPGKTPLILSVDDVAYAYGNGFAQKLTVKEDGSLSYLVKNPQGKTEEMPDGDVMGVLDQFVKAHPDFAYQGHKGTIALTGYQGAFGYSYDTPEGVADIQKVSAALKAEGWNFASHSYTHNRTNFYGPGSNPANIKYDIDKWIAKVTPAIGTTRIFVAPFGYRVKQPGLQYILNDGFEIYCTVDSTVYNELNDTYALMSRIEMSGYSMTNYKATLNKLFYNVDEVFDAKGRPPVI